MQHHLVLEAAGIGILSWERRVPPGHGRFARMDGGGPSAAGLRSALVGGMPASVSTRRSQGAPLWAKHPRGSRRLVMAKELDARKAHAFSVLRAGRPRSQVRRPAFGSGHAGRGNP